MNNNFNSIGIEKGDLVTLQPFKEFYSPNYILFYRNFGSDNGPFVVEHSLPEFNSTIVAIGDELAIVSNDMLMKYWEN